jgi:cell division protein FtsB
MNWETDPVTKMKSLIERYPRVFWFLVGLLVSLIISGFSSHWADKTIEEYKELNQLVIEEYRTKHEQQRHEITRLAQENRKLKQHTKTYKLVKPDGTIEERAESETESEENIASSIKESYEKVLREETTKLHKEYGEKIQKITSETKKLYVSGGVTQDLSSSLGGGSSKPSYWVSVDYMVYMPFIVSGGMVYKPAEQPLFLFGIGIGL